MSVGTMLSAARQAAGLSMADVADATKIRAGVIQSMERDDFSPCGGDVYARGQLRTIARVVGLSADDVLEAYAEQSGVPRDMVPAPDVARIVEVTQAPEVRRQRHFNWSLAMAIALVAIIGVGVVSLVQGGSGRAPSAPVAASSAAESASSPAPTAASPLPMPSSASPLPVPTGAVAQTDDVTMVINVTTSRSWVSVTDRKDRTLFEGIMETGDVQTFTARKLVKVVLGNAGAVELTVNGVDLGSPGGDGEVIRFEFGPGDPTEAFA